MNRVIKFRAFDSRTGRMLNSNSFGNSIHPCSEDAPFIVSLRHIEEITLMQFIGLGDMKMVDIYEGDILSGWRKGSNSDRSYTGFVEWNTQQCGYVIRCGKYLMEILSLAMSGDGESTRLDSFEVIGNIYSNPSLLHNPEKQ
jgi:uncharacterized phage protein (TIGR01671 family)